MRYVIAYDITDDGRRSRVAEYLSGWGWRVQKSVFECNLSREDLSTVVEWLKDRLVPIGDRCHVYRLCGDCAPKRLVIGTDLEAEWAESIVV